MNPLRVAAVQATPGPGDLPGNVALGARPGAPGPAADGARVAVLPELFLSAYHPPTLHATRGADVPPVPIGWSRTGGSIRCGRRPGRTAWWSWSGPRSPRPTAGGRVRPLWSTGPGTRSPPTTSRTCGVRTSGAVHPGHRGGHGGGGRLAPGPGHLLRRLLPRARAGRGRRRGARIPVPGRLPGRLDPPPGRLYYAARALDNTMYVVFANSVGAVGTWRSTAVRPSTSPRAGHWSGRPRRARRWSARPWTPPNCDGSGRRTPCWPTAPLVRGRGRYIRCPDPPRINQLPPLGRAASWRQRLIGPVLRHRRRRGGVTACTRLLRGRCRLPSSPAEPELLPHPAPARGGDTRSERRPHRASARRITASSAASVRQASFRRRRRHLRQARPARSGWRPSTTTPTRGTAGPPGTSPRPTEKGPAPVPRLARHRAGRGRHRARHPEDRQGGRRLPGRARRARHRPVVPAGGQAVPGRGAPHVPPRRRLPGGPPGPASPGSTGRWPAAPTSARRSSPASGPAPSSARCAGCTSWACRCRIRCRSSAPRCCWSSSATPTARRRRRGWPSCGQDTADLPDLWRQLVEALSTMARAGFAHGDLSAYNLLVHDGRLVVIDLPQIVDVVANPRGPRVPRPGRAQRRPPGSPATACAEADGDELAARPALRSPASADRAGSPSLTPGGTQELPMQDPLRPVDVRSGGEHLAQDVLQDAAVAVVVGLAGGVDAHDRVEARPRCRW